MFKISRSLLFALSIGFTAAQSDNVLIGEDQDEASVLLGNLVDRCAIDYDPDADVDYFPTKYSKPTIKSYGDMDIFGEKFVPHNTTDFLEITYHKTYKIMTNKHQDPPKSYLLYQCGTQIPQDVVDAGDFDLVLPVPHKGGIALTQTPQIPYLEMLGLRQEVIAYIGNPIYVTSPCMSHMLGEDATPGRGTSIETFYDSNFTIQEANIQAFREQHPEAIIVSGPTNNVVGDQVVVASTTQERTNVATFDWIHFYATFFNMEGEANRIASEMQESYDCSSDVANDIAQQQRELPEDEEYKEPVIMWANYFTYQDLGWSVAECPTWDTTYYCEYAKHCGATVLSRPEGMGYNRTWGSPTVYWYLNDEEVLEMGKDADIFIFSGADWDSIYALKNETLDQFKAVQNKMVFDTLGQGASAWNEQRYAEYDVVGLDMCDVVGHASKTGPKHTRRWFRNVYTDPIGSMEACDVEGGDISKPFVPPQQECVRPQAALPVPVPKEEAPAAEDEVAPSAEDVEEVPSASDDEVSAAASLATRFMVVMLVIASAFIW
mmetsp:Transcript_4233/g.10987  ORF Transcript_4233/g.10987 Transcript_4233/m.10987 type:complete len:547 (+) Transcript_4233:79-1719(+)